MRLGLITTGLLAAVFMFGSSVFAQEDGAPDPSGDVFLRGDSNNDGAVDLSDIIYTVHYLFLGGDDPVCLAAADANADTAIDISDAITTVQLLFIGGVSSLPAPWPTAGVAPEGSGFGCSGPSGSV